MKYVKTSDGVKIAVYDPNPCGRRTVLLVHGWPLSHEIFEYQLCPLIQRGYRVVTMDLRGFGRSDMPGDGYCYDRLAKDIYEVVKELCLSGFILGGFSMGGAVALRYMRLFCGYGVSGLMLMAAAAPCFTRRPDFPYGVTRQKADELIRQACEDRPQLAWDFSHKQLFARPHSEAVKDWFGDIALSASGPATVQTAVSLREEDGREDLKAVRVRTAVFQGNKDIVVPQELTMYQYRSIPGSVLYQLPESGHGVMYDELERFNGCMLEFIENPVCCR